VATPSAQRIYGLKILQETDVKEAILLVEAFEKEDSVGFTRFYAMKFLVEWYKAGKIDVHEFMHRVKACASLAAA